MKNIWKYEDLIAGLFIIREASPKGSKNLDFARTVTFKIGWNAGTKKLENEYGLISVLTDGMYLPYGSKEDLMYKLNNDLDGYRPLTREELFDMIMHKNTNFY